MIGNFFIEKNINNQVFKKHEEFWLSNLHFDGIDTTFEIFKNEINEPLISSILIRLEDRLLDIKSSSILLLQSLSQFFWGHSNNLEFSFSGFVIDNQIDFQQCDFRMCFHCFGIENFSDYANWFVDIKDFKIVGCWRQQL